MSKISTDTRAYLAEARKFLTESENSGHLFDSTPSPTISGASPLPSSTPLTIAEARRLLETGRLLETEAADLRRGKPPETPASKIKRLTEQWAQEALIGHVSSVTEIRVEIDLNPALKDLMRVVTTADFIDLDGAPHRIQHAGTIDANPSADLAWQIGHHARSTGKAIGEVAEATANRKYRYEAEIEAPLPWWKGGRSDGKFTSKRAQQEVANRRRQEKERIEYLESEEADF